MHQTGSHRRLGGNARVSRPGVIECHWSVLTCYLTGLKLIFTISATLNRVTTPHTTTIGCIKTYQFKIHCKGDSHSSKTATVILPGLVIKQRWTSLRLQAKWYSNSLNSIMLVETTHLTHHAVRSVLRCYLTGLKLFTISAALNRVTLHPTEQPLIVPLTGMYRISRPDSVWLDIRPLFTIRFWLRFRPNCWEIIAMSGFHFLFSASFCR